MKLLHLVIAAGLLFYFVAADAPHAQALLPATGSMQFCLNFFSSSSEAEQTCAFSSDCPTQLTCHQNRCIAPDQIGVNDDDTDLQQAALPPPDPLPDDGGADALCGTDRRCRIERIASRNRQRRHLQIAEQERRTQLQVAQILDASRQAHNRQDRPWSANFQLHPTGYGVLLGRSINAHLRAEISAVIKEEYIYFTPDDPQYPAVDSLHFAGFGFGHFVFLPSKGWFSPMVSAGFGMGWGTLHGHFSDSSSSPSTRFHLVTAAIGADAQLNSGFTFRLAFRHGRLLYNQVRYGAGSYNAGLRNSMREYMNSQGLWGLDLSFGWAF